MKRILFMIIPAALLILALRPIHYQEVKGKITDENGAALAGVSVVIKSTKAATASGADGSYQLSLGDSRAVLVFSKVGYKTQEIKVNGKATIDVVMHASKQMLNEVVVIGYSTKHRSEASGSVSKVSSRDMIISNYNSPVQNPAPPGMQVERKRMIYDTNNDKDEEAELFNTEGYDNIVENTFMKATDNPLSTFSIDVDAASYSNVRRFINEGQLPPAGAVRIEEMVNYFKYEYPQPENDQPFSINTEISDAPWNKDHKLVLIGLQGKKIPVENLPASNLVFLIDVSGSMQGPERLGLVQASMKLLVDQLREQDKVSIVVYAGAAGLVLQPTSGDKKTTIKNAIDNLEAGGSTAGGAGIKLAYKTANEFFVKGGNNRVILCTDGDFNVGESSDDAMENLIEKERNSGVFLTVLGYGMGNYQDSKMQKLADKGNGNHAYIDGISEAKKVLVNEFGGTLFTIAKDVKLQIEFNPEKVQGYRLIGYENRMLAKEDFNDDKKDAGELGSGHTVTALYELIPVGVKSSFIKSVDPLKYQSKIEAMSKTSHNNEIMTVKFRFKAPDGNTSKLIEHPLMDDQIRLAKTSDNFRFAASVAEFGMLLRGSEFKSASSYEDVISMARRAKGNDDEGYRAEFIRMVENADLLAKGKKVVASDEEEVGKR